MTNKVTGLIILEGPDGAGKTTLGKALCDQFDGLYVHRTYAPDMDIWDHHTEGLRIAQEQAHEKLVVLDRLWPSELIYGRVFRGQGYYGGYNARSMDRVVLRMCGLHVLCIPEDIEYVVKTHAEKKQRGEEMFDTVRDVAVRYLDWLKGSVVRDPKGDLVEQTSAFGGFLATRSDGYHYDVVRDGKRMKQQMKWIIDKLRARQDQQYQLALSPQHQNFLGYLPEARYLIIGEELGDPQGWSKWPFYGRNNSADFLNKSLHEIAWDEPLGVWTNAINSDPHIEQIMKIKPELKVVCLGAIAKRKCEELGVPIHKVVHHPQWARRFNHNGQNGEPYHEELRKALS